MRNRVFLGVSPVRVNVRDRSSNRSPRLGLVLAVLPVVWLACPSRSEAQVDESLVTRRWKTDNFWAETYDKPIWTSRGRVEDPEEGLQMLHWVSEGRIKFSRRDLDPPVWIGYRALTISVISESDLLGHTFSDVALAVAARLGSIGEDWSVTASAGAGTANDGRWDDPHSVFPVATLEFTRVVDPSTFWHVGLSLDGNRGLLPAYPLPYAMVEATIDPSLSFLLGFPKSEVVVRPLPSTLLTLQWSFPSNASARAEADLGAGFGLFGEASRRVDGFHLRHHDRTRLFFEMNTAELGVRWVTKWMDVSLSVGYAFGQRFFTGTDLVGRTRGSSVEDLPFVALTFPSTFWSAPFSSAAFR
jgi:hypothetical protein